MYNPNHPTQITLEDLEALRYGEIRVEKPSEVTEDGISQGEPIQIVTLTFQLKPGVHKEDITRFYAGPHHDERHFEAISVHPTVAFINSLAEVQVTQIPEIQSTSEETSQLEEPVKTPEPSSLSSQPESPVVPDDKAKGKSEPEAPQAPLIPVDDKNKGKTAK